MQTREREFNEGMEESPKAVRMDRMDKFDASKIRHIEGQELNTPAERHSWEFLGTSDSALEKPSEMAEKMDYYHNVAIEYKEYLANPGAFFKKNGAERSAEYNKLAEEGVPPGYIARIGELRGEAVGALRDYQEALRGKTPIDLATDKVLFAVRGIALAIQAVGEVNKRKVDEKRRLYIHTYTQSPEFLLIEQRRILLSRMSAMASEELGMRRGINEGKHTLADSDAKRAELVEPGSV